MILLKYVQQILITQKSKKHEKLLDVLQVMLNKKNYNFYLVS